MPNDIFDTRFEGKDIELENSLVFVGDDVNLNNKDPALRNILIGSGWDLNAFNADALDLDLSLFFLNKDNMTRQDSDFLFYNQREAFEGGVKHHGDSRTGAGDGDDEVISLDLQVLPYDIVRILISVTIYKGYEKEQNLDMVRNAYVRITNPETGLDYCRYQLDEVLTDKQDTGVVVGFLDREGPKWHFKPQAEFIEGGLGELARRHGMIINQE